MGKRDPIGNGLIVFFISFFCICLELFLTRILNLKTFNHVVYVIIPFTLLGLGIGTNLYLLLESKIKRFPRNIIVSYSLFFIALSSLGSVLLLIPFPIDLDQLKNIFTNFQGAFLLSSSYFLVIVPYGGIGFLLIYLFSLEPEKSAKLYFWDLVGAGCGAGAFFVLINITGVFRSVVILSFLIFALGVMALPNIRQKAAFCVLVIGFFGILFGVPEVQNYRSNKDGWENFPHYFKADEFETVLQRWHPLGRTDAYRLIPEDLQVDLYKYAHWTFQVPLFPFPDFTYFTTNFLAGTPVYKYSYEGLRERNSQVRIFINALEVPYSILDKPKVFVIGAGGGRDIFTAKAHGVTEIVGAEINPGIYTEMSEGGRLSEYSGGIYYRDNVNVHNIDGRHLVKKLPKDHFDLIVLNGVDTFYGLSSGAYTYAESYLYTKEAITDYVRILNDDGIINFNRWFFPDKPRETLRLFVTILEALRSMKVEKPWEHVIVGQMPGGITLVKKTPFTEEDRLKIGQYFRDHRMRQIFPSAAILTNDKENFNYFDQYANAFGYGRQDEFIRDYSYDISVVTDDKPFFYKFYKFFDFSLSKVSKFVFIRGAGYLVYLTQILVLFHAIVFILLFIFLPLYLNKKDPFTKKQKYSPWVFVSYFACLGLGFMFVEIPLMQQFTLLLGSPIYSISITLAALLIFSGLGSLCLDWFQKKTGRVDRVILYGMLTLGGMLFLVIILKEFLLSWFVGFSFLSRILIVCLMLLPIGLSLGVFFPSGLQLIKKDSIGLMPWAWGINFGFSVLGSMLAIILAQNLGFRSILILALFVYLFAFYCFNIMFSKEL